MRKNLLTAIIPLAAVCLFAPITEIKADTISDDTGAYTVTIPSDVSIDQNSRSADLVVSADVEAYNKLSISIASDNTYQLKCGDNYGLAYTLTDDGENEVGQITYSTQEGNKQIFSTTLKAKLNDNTSAKISGTYSDTLRFTMSCQECYPEGKAGLSFDANGGTATTDKKVLNIGAEYGTLPEATRTGYTFAGWYTEKNAGDQVSENNRLLENTTVYAHWTANTYKVIYDNNVAEHTKASGSMEASTMTYDSEQKLTKSKIENSDTGSHFVGWNTAADGTGTAYTDEQKVLNLTSDDKGSVILYAQWKYENIVKVQFEDVKGDYLDENTENVIEETLPAGKKISWSVNELEAYKNNQQQWEKQWQTPDNNGNVAYTTSNESKTTTVKIARQMYYLDLNSQWYEADGTPKGGGGNLIWDTVQTAEVEVKINGEVQQGHTAVYDYFVQQRYGSTFEFTVTMREGYQFNGVADRSSQPLSDVKVSGNVVTGIVTGEKYVNNTATGGKVYYATTVPLNIQKISSTSTTTSNEEQSPDETTVNSDGIGSDQDVTQNEETEIDTEPTSEEVSTESRTQSETESPSVDTLTEAMEDEVDIVPETQSQKVTSPEVVQTKGTAEAVTPSVRKQDQPESEPQENTESE